MDLFQQLFQRALQSEVKEPEAMALSTSKVITDGQYTMAIPSTRFVLCKRADEKGIVWFSNYESRKGNEIASNPYASVAFYWKELSLSIRMTGKVDKVDPSESNEYFQSRPVGSRVGAWASPQSRVIEGRSDLDRHVSEIEARFNVEAGSADRAEPTASDKAADISLPPYWGGYRLAPLEVEFWAGRPNRLHDRWRYTRTSDATEWTIDRLAP